MENMNSFFGVYSYPFGMVMPGRNEQAGDGYRYGYQGQESDDEVKGKGNSINYKYRMHDPRVGRFFSIDPLTVKYPHNSPYAFSENIVIHAIELEGLESEVIIQWFDENDIHQMVLLPLAPDSPNNDNNGPLGSGTVWISLMGDGTYIMEFIAGENNPYYEEGTKIKKEGLDKIKWNDVNKLFRGILQETAVEEALIELGFDESEVRDDVTLYSEDDELLGEFAALENSNKYTKNWDQTTPSTNHKGTNAYESGAIGNLNYELKYYDGRGGHIGIVVEGIFDHALNDGRPFQTDAEYNEWHLDNAKDLLESLGEKPQ